MRNGPLTQGEVEAEIMRISDDMEVALDDLESKAHDAAMAEHKYKVEYAKELLKAGHEADGKITVGDKEAKATEATSLLLRERLTTDAYHNVAQEKMRTMRARIDALRTVSANLRAQT